jgi:uncharacterized HAD superfamily protein
MFVYNLFRKLLFSVLKLSTFVWFYQNKYLRIVVFDLDNTVAYYNYSNSTRNELLSYRLKTMKVYTGVLKLMLAYKKKNYRILILTARDYRFYNVTRNWLKKNNVPFDKLILVHSPTLKKSILKQTQNVVTYYDDLSYNHENNHIQFYNELISYFNEKDNIKYFSLNQFKRFQKLSK